MKCNNCKKYCKSTKMTAQEATDATGGHALYLDTVEVSDCCEAEVETSFLEATLDFYEAVKHKYID